MLNSVLSFWHYLLRRWTWWRHAFLSDNTKFKASAKRAHKKYYLIRKWNWLEANVLQINIRHMTNCDLCDFDSKTFPKNKISFEFSVENKEPHWNHLTLKISDWISFIIGICDFFCSPQAIVHDFCINNILFNDRSFCFLKIVVVH